MEQPQELIEVEWPTPGNERRGMTNSSNKLSQMLDIFSKRFTGTKIWYDELKNNKWSNNQTYASVHIDNWRDKM